MSASALVSRGRESEDLFMYPRLREQWARTADPALGAALATHYERLSATLKVHLRREVTEVTPAVEKVLTEKEFDQLASHGIPQTL